MFLKTVSNREIEVHTEDEQAFLARQQQAIQQGQTPTSRGESPMRSQNTNKTTPRTPVSSLLSSSSCDYPHGYIVAVIC